MTQREKRITWPVVVVVVTGAVVVLAGGLIAWLRPGQLLPGGVPVGAGVHLYAERMAARSIPIGVGLLVLLWLRERRMLAGLLLLVGVIEIGDTIAAIVNRDWAELSGAVVAVAFFWAAWSLLRRSGRAGLGSPSPTRAGVARS
jgi:hypothetical protein